MLKQAVMKEPALVFLDHTKTFEIQTNASDFAIGDVLMQEGHSIAFESRKLNKMERKYTVQLKEMTVIVHCFRTWRHYLLGAKFKVKTNNVATSYFLTQNKLTLKQVRWQMFLTEFNFTMEHKPRKANCVVDALSWRAELASISSLTFPLASRIQEGLPYNPQAKKILEPTSGGKTHQF